MKKLILVFAIIFATSAVFVSCKSEKKEEKKVEVKAEIADKNVYQCPMKCEKEKTYDKEGTCPVCKMKLKKKKVKETEE